MALRSLTPFSAVVFLAVTAGCSGGGGAGVPAVAPHVTSTSSANTLPQDTAAPAPASSAAGPSATTPTASPSSAPVATPTVAPTADAYEGVMSSDAFVSTMGVDVGLTSATASEESELASLFAGLGVRQTRLSVIANNSSYDALVYNFFSVNPSVYTFGLTSCASPLGPGSTSIAPADVSAFQSAIGNHLNFVEGVNEPDDTGDSNWVNDTRSCIAPFAGGVNGLPLVAPALVTQLYGTSQNALGSLAGIASYGNIHRYFSGRNPDAPGWGSSDSCGSYGALDWAICWAHVTTPGMPLVVTESGWNSNSEVDLATQAKYVERVFFVNAQAGIAITSLYTMLGYTGGDDFGGDGLLNPDYSVKPAYTALSNLTKVLADPGPSFYPLALSYTMSPAPVASGDGLRAMVLGKRNGNYDIALWQEVQSANPNSYGVDTPPAPVTVTLAFPSTYSATTYAWQSNGSAPASSAVTGSSFQISVTDRMTVVEISPSGSAASSSAGRAIRR